MAGTYLPLTDGGLNNWGSNFLGQLTAQGAGLGVTPEQILAYGEVQSAYAVAYAAATTPQTRGTATIQAKNDAKTPLIVQSRELAMVITNNPVTTDLQRVEFGLTVRDEDPTPVPVPTEAPVVMVPSVEGRLLILRLRALGSDTRAKPAGVGSAWIYTFVGDVIPTFEQLEFRGSVTRTDTKVVMPVDVPAGSKVWVSACWVSTSKKAGPVSLPVFTWTNHGAMQNQAA